MTKNKKGMSLVEILIVILVFSVLGVIITRSVLLTLRGTKKSESQIKVRENLNYSLAVIERQLRNADSLITACPNTSDTSRIDYTDEQGNPSSFSCIGVGGNDSYIASGSANLRLTVNDIVITSCSFTCEATLSDSPLSVDVSVVAKDKNAIGIEGAEVSTETKIYLRNY